MAITPAVRFDVGGIIYNVARSLLEQHPNTVMAKMASAVWNGEPPSSDSSNVGEKGTSGTTLFIDGNGEPPSSESSNVGKKSDTSGTTLFIDGNGDRFQYVLDYMRRGKVTLPQGKISKASLLEDLDYYGFENVSSDSIQVEFLMSEAMDSLKSFEKTLENKRKAVVACNEAEKESFQTKKKKALEDIKSMKKAHEIKSGKDQTMIECIDFVISCYRKFLETGQSQLIFSKLPINDNQNVAFNFCKKAKGNKDLRRMSRQCFWEICGWTVVFIRDESSSPLHRGIEIKEFSPVVSTTE